MNSFLTARIGTLLFAAVSAAVAQPVSGPSVRDIVEFTHIAQPERENNDALTEQVSPDGTKAFIVTRKADVASDKNRYEIQLLDLIPEHLSAQNRPSPLTVFSVAIANDNSADAPAFQDVKWHGDQTLVFMARLEGEAFQVYRFDVPQRKLTQLTHETNLIVSYGVSEDLRRVLYAVKVPNLPLKDGEHQVVVGNQSFWYVKFGQRDHVDLASLHQFLVTDVGSSGSARPLGGPTPLMNNDIPRISMSPDGRWALLPRYEPNRLDEWAHRYPLIADYQKRYARSQQVDPLQYFSRPSSYVPRRMTAWRLDDGQEQTVVDAPDAAAPGDEQSLALGLWQRAGTSVIVAGTFLPPLSNGDAVAASHIIEYWPDSGRWIDVAVLKDHLRDVHALRDGFVVMDGTRRREFRRTNGMWRQTADTKAAPSKASSSWTLRIAQGLNQPPDVYADGPAGETRRLTALAPQFDTEHWGTMRPYSWQDASGKRWDGGLLSSSRMDPLKRYPLVIQTYDFPPDRFYLDGPNGYPSAFAGRAFLQHDILVLALPLRPANYQSLTYLDALEVSKSSVRSAVDALVKDGRVDPAKIGIIGFSSTGERVLSLIAFDDLPIRAATLADGDALTLFSLAVTYGGSDTTWGRKEALAGGLPFGSGWPAWVRNDAALHTECIRAATRIETYGPWVLNNWDVYALMRRQYKPVEMIVLPGGTHTLSTPGDRMASLQGNVDWYGFWLAGKTRTVPLRAPESVDSVAAQYARWREMEELKKVDDARPHCAR